MPKPIELRPEQAAYVESLVAAGRYASTEAAVLEGIRLLQAREARFASVREAWREGVDSGDHEPIDAVLDELAARYTSLVEAEA